MIDLEFAALPDSIVVDGRDVKVHTSFRVWLRWGRMLTRRGIALGTVLAEPCDGHWLEPAIEFYKSENPTPRGKDNRRLIDVAMDGDYVVGSFQQAYGIDLTQEDMHWHRFLALLRSLPSDTKLMEVAGYRAWKRSKRSQESVMHELKEEWALPATDWDRPVSQGASDFLDANEAHLRERLGGGERE